MNVSQDKFKLFFFLKKQKQIQACYLSVNINQPCLFFLTFHFLHTVSLKFQRNSNNK